RSPGTRREIHRAALDRARMTRPEITGTRREALVSPALLLPSARSLWRARIWEEQARAEARAVVGSKKRD
ncbi:MAG TPA: hypothetical protein VKP30_12290, partial [Polyangiaceae bacterium]|nr:hypothetical protein [Polyangiaceae bacterium]